MKTIRLALLTIAALTIATPAQADFTIVAGWEQQLFPSYLIATAAIKPNKDAEQTQLGDPDGQIGVILQASKSGERATVTVSCNEFMEASEYSCVLPEAGETYNIFPKIRFRYDRLSQCKQATPATLTVRVQVGKAPAEEASTTVMFRSINDCPLKVVSGEEVIDTTFAFAAYVNEQHPFVDKLLREALDLGVVDRFTGYQDKDRGAVIRQVYAVWDLMVARDVRYSDITATAADSNEVLSQHVRMIEETANNSQANCVDGSVLLVSMLRKIGIDAALVLEPGHCYIAFAVDPKGEELYGLETTLIDSEADEPEELPEFIEDAVAEDLRGEQSWPSFIAALGHATQQLAANTEKYKSQEDVDYKIISIARFRQLGVPPIAFDAKEQFVSYDHSSYLTSTDSDEYEETTSEEEWSEETDAESMEADDADGDDTDAEEDDGDEESDDEDTDEDDTAEESDE